MNRLKIFVKLLVFFWLVFMAFRMQFAPQSLGMETLSLIALVFVIGAVDQLLQAILLIADWFEKRKDDKG